MEHTVLWVLPVLIAVVLHEIAHGLVAYLRGDPTAKDAGRLTLNPLPHIDAFGSVILPALLYFTGAPLLFGYAKPIPVNPLRLHHPRIDMALVALAGPMTNVTLAMVSAQLLHHLSAPLGPFRLLASDAPWPPGFELALTSVLLNSGLAVFNMLPILPLDGGRVLAGLLPRRIARLYARTERFGLPLVMLLAATDVLSIITRPLRRLLLEAIV